MTPVFITGPSAEPLQTLSQQLANMGLPPAQALARDHTITLKTWHQQVHAAGHAQPGRMWEQLAAELLLANMAQPQWSWADPLTLPLLDYWADFDPAIRFLLLAETPLHATLQHLAHTDTAPTPQDLPKLLNHWQQAHTAMLRFALRHPQRCLLVWADQAQQHPQALGLQLHNLWGLHSADTTTRSPPPAQGPDQLAGQCSLAQHIGSLLCQNNPPAQQLLADLHASVQPLHNADTALLPGPSGNAPSPLQLLASYQELRKHQHHSAKLPKLQSDLKAAQTQRDKAMASDKARAEQLTQLQAQINQLKTELQNAQDKATQAQTQAAQQLSAQQKETQTQRDKATTADKHRAAAEQARTQADQARTQAEQARTQAEQATQAAQHTLAQTQSELQQTKTQLKENQEEAELLLNQLHVVQEELENYYYRNKELQAQAQALAALQQRWQQLFAQHKDLYAVENLHIEAQPDARYRCRLSQLHMAGRHFEQLEITVQSPSDGSPLLHLTRPAEDHGPLLRWPVDVPAGGDLVLQPHLQANTPPQRVAALMQLSTSDWQLVQNLPRLLHAALAQNTLNLTEADHQQLQTALQQTLQQLPNLRGMLRFDKADCPQPPTATQLQLQLQNTSLQHQVAEHMALQLQLHHPDDLQQGLSLSLNANPITGPAQQLHLTPNGWYADPQDVATDHTVAKPWLAQLLAMLPLAMVDAVHQGTDKNSLKPWADKVRTLRQWPQTPCPPPVTPPVAKAPPKTKTKDKAPPKTKDKAKAAPKTEAPLKAQVAPKSKSKAKPQPALKTTAATPAVQPRSATAQRPNRRKVAA